MELYRWQRECLKAWQDNGCRGILHVATGAGKTRFALAAIQALRQRHPNLEVRVVVPTIALARQWLTALTHGAPSEAWRPGLYGGGRRDRSDRRVMVYVVNSARDALPAHMRRAFALGHPVLLICDECHHCQSPQNRRVFDFITPQVLSGGLYASLGLSATPFDGEGGGILERALGKEIYRYDIDDAVSDGVLSSFAVGEVSAPFSASEDDDYRALTESLYRLLKKLLELFPFLKPMGTEARLRAIRRLARDAGMDPEEPAAAYMLLLYRRKEISVLAEARVRCCVELLSRLEKGERILVFCERIAQAEQTVAALRRSRGEGVGIYHSGMSPSARARNLERFRTGEVSVLVSCRCLDEGIDVPEACFGVVLSSSAVPRQRIQRLGRIIRTAPGKEAACLYYIYIRQSADDAAFLPGLEQCETFGLRYYDGERSFSNEAYELAASELLSRAEGLEPSHQREMRDCLVEGLTRADCLLPAAAQERHIRAAATVHERNYWRCMKKIGGMLRGTGK